MNEEVTVRLVREWDAHEIADLYRAGGWWREDYAESGIPALIRGSFLFAVAVDRTSGRAVGMGRVISDGVSDGYIQDLVVLPSCRGAGVGREIVRTLLTACGHAGVTWVGLIAEPGTEAFYQPLGFHPMTDHIPLIFRGDST